MDWKLISPEVEKDGFVCLGYGRFSGEPDLTVVSMVFEEGHAWVWRQWPRQKRDFHPIAWAPLEVEQLPKPASTASQ